MDDKDQATLLWLNELVTTLIKRMSAANILSEHGADALAEDVRAHAAAKFPEYERQFRAHAAFLQTGIREECEAVRNRR